MHKLTSTNVVLGLVLVLLVFFAIYSEEEFQQPNPIHLLTTQVISEIKKIEIVRASENTLLFLKQEQGWVLLNSSSGKSILHFAKQKKIALMLSLLEAKVFKKFSVKPQQLKKFELDNPRISVYFNDIKISFGSINPVTRHRYINIGATIYSVNDFFYAYFLAEEDGYISKQTLINRPKFSENIDGNED